MSKTRIATGSKRGRQAVEAAPLAPAASTTECPYLLMTLVNLARIVRDGSTVADVASPGNVREVAAIDRRGARRRPSLRPTQRAGSDRPSDDRWT